MAKRSDMPEWKTCVYSGSLRPKGGGVFAYCMVFEALDL